MAGLKARERRERARRDPSLIKEHGSAVAYTYWLCRCEVCTQGNRDRQREQMAERDQRIERARQDPSLIKEHGSVTAYSYWGCRCRECKTANTLRCRRWRETGSKTAPIYIDENEEL